MCQLCTTHSCTPNAPEAKVRDSKSWKQGWKIGSVLNTTYWSCRASEISSLPSVSIRSHAYLHQDTWVTLSWLSSLSEKSPSEGGQAQNNPLRGAWLKIAIYSGLIVQVFSSFPGEHKGITSKSWGSFLWAPTSQSRFTTSVTYSDPSDYHSFLVERQVSWHLEFTLFFPLKSHSYTTFNKLLIFHY